MSTIRADLSQYYALKALLETILGRTSFRRVKDCAPLQVWKVESRRLIRALAVAVDSTVEVADSEWKDQVRELLDRGLARVRSSPSIDERFASLAATLGELAFLQNGFVPLGHSRVDLMPLTTKNWRLDCVRSVQYVQNPKQRALQARLHKPRRQNGEA